MRSSTGLGEKAPSTNGAEKAAEMPITARDIAPYRSARAAEVRLTRNRPPVAGYTPIRPSIEWAAKMDR